MGLTIGEAEAAYSEHLAQQDLKPGTVDVYRRDLAKFVEFFGKEKDVAAITVLRINNYVKSNRLLKDDRGKVLAKETVNRSKRVCRGFLEWLVSAGHAPELPAGGINAFKC